MRKLILVYNPQSSRHARIEREVLPEVRKVPGFLVAKYQVEPLSVRGNAEKLAELMGDGDLVIVAGGDGTATVAVNGVILSGRDVTLAVMEYGNFNDTAGALGRSKSVTEIVERFLAGKVKTVYPLKVMIDGALWRYALCYATMGMAAEATGMFGEKRYRKKLQTGKVKKITSYVAVARWYFWHRRKKGGFVPEGEMYAERLVGRAREVMGVGTGEQMCEVAGVGLAEQVREVAGVGLAEQVREVAGVGMTERACEMAETGVEGRGYEVLRRQALKGKTDIIALNVPRMARVMKGRKWMLKRSKFGVGVFRLRRSLPLLGFMLKSMLCHVPLEEAERLVVEFLERSRVMIQAEGEREEVLAKRVEIEKIRGGMKVVMG